MKEEETMKGEKMNVDMEAGEEMELDGVTRELWPTGEYKRF